MSKSIKALIFDLDDTLIDDSINWINSVEKIGEYLLSNFSFPKDLSIKRILESYRFYSDYYWSNYNIFLKPIGDNHKIRRFVWTKVFHNLKIVDISSQDLDIIVNLFAHYREQIVPNINLLKQLHLLNDIYKLAICTNGNRKVQMKKIMSANLHNVFEIITCSDDIHVRKPDKRLFEYCLSQLGVLPRECVFIGDSWDCDIRGSLDMGMRSIWITKEKVIEELPSGVEIYSCVEDFNNCLLNDTSKDER